jgi:hypothetical protein
MMAVNLISSPNVATVAANEDLLTIREDASLEFALREMRHVLPDSDL